MGDFAADQLQLAQEVDIPQFLAEAYWNLARSKELLCAFDKALHYCKQSIYHVTDHNTLLTTNIYITLAKTFVGLSNYSKAVEHYDMAYKIAKDLNDPALEVQVYVGFGEIFSILQDYEKGVRFIAKAYELSKTFQVCDGNSRYQRLALLTLAHPLRKLGKLKESKRCCQVNPILSFSIYWKCGIMIIL